MNGTITIEEAEAAFKKTGLKPVRRKTYSSEENCGCIIAVLCVAETGFTSVGWAEICVWANQKYGTMYIFGVIHGWDGIVVRGMTATPEYNKGISDGTMLAAHFFKEGSK